MPQGKAIFYIDGFSLYFGLKSAGFRKYYWLDLNKLCANILSSHPGQVLTGIKYFTARISSPPDKALRQKAYLEAVNTLRNVEVIEGIYHQHPIFCKLCQSSYLCRCGHSYSKPEEKRTDVNIAVNMLCDAYNNNFDIAYLISGDSDLVPIVVKIKENFPDKMVVLFSPPYRVSIDLKNVCHANRKFYEGILKKSQFDLKIKSGNEFIIERPSEWA